MAEIWIIGTTGNTSKHAERTIAPDFLQGRGPGLPFRCSQCGRFDIFWRIRIEATIRNVYRKTAKLQEMWLFCRIVTCSTCCPMSLFLFFWGSSIRLHWHALPSKGARQQGEDAKVWKLLSKMRFLDIFGRNWESIANILPAKPVRCELLCWLIYWSLTNLCFANKSLSSTGSLQHQANEELARAQYLIADIACPACFWATICTAKDKCLLLFMTSIEGSSVWTCHQIV